jgi:hypothetical protein
METYKIRFIDSSYNTLFTINLSAGYETAGNYRRKKCRTGVRTA